MAKPATVSNIKDAKKDRKSLFSQKVRYGGATATLTLYVREGQNGKFKVYALHEKPGQDKKLKGALTEHPTKEAAIAKFTEIGAECVKAGWKLKEAANKSAFDVIPAAD